MVQFLGALVISDRKGYKLQLLGSCVSLFSH